MFKSFSVQRVSCLILFSTLLGMSSSSFAKDKPYEVGDDFQSTIEVVHANRHLHVGDFLHVTDVHGQQVGLVRISRFDSEACVARVVDGVAPKGSLLVKDQQMTADRNRRSHVRAIASVDPNADKVGAERRDEGAKQESSVDGEVSGWRAWTPIKGMPMRKMVFLGFSPTSAYVASSSATPKFNFGFSLGVVAEFMKDLQGFEVGLQIYQAGFNDTYGVNSEKVALTYVGVPVMYKYALRASEEGEWHIKAGLMPAYLLSKKYTLDTTLKSTSSSTFNMSSFDALLMVGTDYLFLAQNPEALNYWAQVTLGFGLTDASIMGKSAHNELLNFAVGIFF